MRDPRAHKMYSDARKLLGAAAGTANLGPLPPAQMRFLVGAHRELMSISTAYKHIEQFTNPLTQLAVPAAAAKVLTDAGYTNLTSLYKSKFRGIAPVVTQRASSFFGAIGRVMSEDADDLFSAYKGRVWSPALGAMTGRAKSKAVSEVGRDLNRVYRTMGQLTSHRMLGANLPPGTKAMAFRPMSNVAEHILSTSRAFSPTLEISPTHMMVEGTKLPTFLSMGGDRGAFLGLDALSSEILTRDRDQFKGARASAHLGRVGEFVWTPSIRPTKSGGVRRASFKELEQEIIRGIGRGKSRTVADILIPQLRYEGPYAAEFYSHMGQLQLPIDKKGTTFEPLSKQIKVAKDRARAEASTTSGIQMPGGKTGFSYGDSIRLSNQYATETIIQNVGQYSGISVWPVKDLQATMGRGMLFTKGLGEMFTFGLYDDPSRAPMQRVRIGKIDPRMSGLMREMEYDVPLVMSTTERKAASAYKMRTGSPVGITGKIGIVLEEAGKTPFSQLVDTEQGEVVLDRLMAMSLQRDTTANQMIQMAGHRGLFEHGHTPESWLRKLGLQGLNTEGMFDKGRFVYGPIDIMVGGYQKLTPKGVAETLAWTDSPSGGKITSGFNMLMSQTKVHAKYPAQARRILLGSILHQIGPQHKWGNVREAQTKLIRDIQKAILPRGMKAPKNAWFKDDRGRSLPYLSLGQNELLELGQYQDIERATTRFGRTMKGAGLSRRVTPGFNISEQYIAGLPIKEGMRKVVEFYDVATLREFSNNISSVLHASLPTATGVPRGLGGQKITEALIRNTKGLRTPEAQAVAKLLERYRKLGAQGTGFEVKRFMAVLSSGADTSFKKLAETLLPGSQLAKDVILDVSGFRKAFKGLSSMPSGRELMELAAAGKMPALAGTILDVTGPAARMFDTPHYLNLSRSIDMTYKVGGETITKRISQIPIPNLSMMYGRTLASAEASGKLFINPEQQKWSTFLTEMANKGQTPRAEELGLDALSSTYKEMTGKKGSLRSMLEPKAAGSWHGKVVGMFRTAEEAAPYQGMVQPGTAKLGRVGISEEMAARYSIKDLLTSKKKSKSVFGYMTRYPEQAVGNSWAVELYVDRKLSGGSIGVLQDLMSVMHGDTDKDTASLIISPFKRGTDEFDEWQGALGKLHHQLERQYSTGQLITAGARQQGIADLLTQASKVGPWQNPKQWFQAESDAWSAAIDEFSELTELIDPSDPKASAKIARARLGFEKAMKTAKGPLLRFIGDKGPGTGAGRMMLQQMSSVKEATGFVVSALSKFAAYSELTPTSATNLLGKAGEKSRAQLNAAIFIGNAIQEGSIKKATLSNIRFFDESKAYWSAGISDDAQKQARATFSNYVTETMERQASEYIPGDSTGLRYIEPSKGYRSARQEYQAVADDMIDTLDKMGSGQKFLNSSRLDKLMGNFAGTGGGVIEEDLEHLQDILLNYKVDKSGSMIYRGAKISDDRTAMLGEIFAELGMHDPKTGQLGFDPGSYVIEKAQAELNEISESISMKNATVPKFMDRVDNVGIWSTLKETKPGQSVSNFWSWLTKGPQKFDKHYDLKRAGVIAGAAILGTSIVKSALFPNIVPPDHSSSYVDLAPPHMSSNLGDPSQMAYSTSTGGRMPSAAPMLGQSVRDTQVQVVQGPAMGPGAYKPMPAGGSGMAPLPPPSAMDALASSSPNIGRANGPTPMLREVHDMQTPSSHFKDMVDPRAFIASTVTEPIPLDSPGRFSYNASKSRLSLDSYSLFGSPT